MTAEYLSFRHHQDYWIKKAFALPNHEFFCLAYKRLPSDRDISQLTYYLMLYITTNHEGHAKS